MATAFVTTGGGFQPVMFRPDPGANRIRYRVADRAEPDGLVDDKGKETHMLWITKPTARVICRRSIIAALAAIVAVGSTAGSLLAAGPKIKSRNAVPAGHASKDATTPSQALAAGPVQTPGDSIPGWFPPGPGSAGEYYDLRELLRKNGDKDGNGCISEAEARKLFEEIQREWEGVRPGEFIRGSYWFDKWLLGKGYLRQHQLRRAEIVVSIWKRFVFNRDGLMSFENFKTFLQSLGLMCSATPSAPSGGGGAGSPVMLPELPY